MLLLLFQTAGGTSHAVAGAVAGESAVAGALSVARPVAGSIAGISTIAGAASIARTLAGAVAGESAVTGALIASYALAGNPAAESTIAGAASIARTLAGAVAGESAVAGAITLFTIIAPLSIDARTLTPTWHDERSITLSETTMTAFNEELKDIVIGDDRRIFRVYATLPTGYTISKAWLTIKKRQTDADVDALIQKTITSASTAAGQITDASTTGGSIAMYFDLDATDTDGMPTRKPCHYDIQIKTSDGDVHTLEVGTVTFVQGITVSIS